MSAPAPPYFAPVAAPPPRIRQECPACGKGVRAEFVQGTAFWNRNLQKWVLEEAFDAAFYCDSCDPHHSIRPLLTPIEDSGRVSDVVVAGMRAHAARPLAAPEAA